MRKPDNVSRPVREQRKWEVTLSPTALRRLERLPPAMVQDILDKIEWLRSDADSIRHARLNRQVQIIGISESEKRAGEIKEGGDIDGIGDLRGKGAQGWASFAT